MEQIEAFIQKEQSRLLTQIHKITNTHLPISSFSIRHFQHSQHAAQPYLKHIALSHLSYRLRNVRPMSKGTLIQEFYCWRKQKCSEKDVLNEELFENKWYFFQNAILSKIYELIGAMPEAYITRLTDEGFVSVEMQEDLPISALLIKSNN